MDRRHVHVLRLIVGERGRGVARTKSWQALGDRVRVQSLQRVVFRPQLGLHFIEATRADQLLR